MIHINNNISKNAFCNILCLYSKPLTYLFCVKDAMGYNLAPAKDCLKFHFNPEKGNIFDWPYSEETVAYSGLYDLSALRYNDVLQFANCLV